MSSADDRDSESSAAPSRKPDWNELKLRTALYLIKCCPSCGHEDLCPRATGPTWSCQKCNVRFTVTNPSYLKRKGKGKA